jgi:flagellar biosynthesis component FlhA
MVAIVVSVVVCLAGLWVVMDQAGTEMASFGWLLLVCGLVFLVVNLALRRRGFGVPRRRR